MPVYIYDHSGVWLSVDKRYPFDDPWDAGVLGFILWTPEEFEKHGGNREAEAIMRGYFEEYRAYVEGEVYTISVAAGFDDILALISKRSDQDYALEDLSREELQDCLKYAEKTDSVGGVYLGDDSMESVVAESFGVTNLISI